MKKLKLLDLYCCGGGAGKGYSLAGFDVVGVDIEKQPKYPFEFYLSDAIEYLMKNYGDFDAVHASPPCQAYTLAGQQHRKSGKEYKDLVEVTRGALIDTGLPFVIENVPHSPLIDPVELCGSMFDLQTYRHRLFESNFKIVPPHHPDHVAKNTKMGRAPVEGEFIQVVGHFSGVPFARKAMGIDWLGQKELAQAIPPAYTEYIGLQLIKHIRGG